MGSEQKGTIQKTIEHCIWDYERFEDNPKLRSEDLIGITRAEGEAFAAIERELLARAEAAESEIKRRDAFEGCDGCSTGDCPHTNYPDDCIKAQAEIIAEQEARIVKVQAERDELREVVDRLPKTADGVPVCPGDSNLWGSDADGEIIEHCVAPYYLMTEGGEYEGWHIVERGGDPHDQLIPAHEVFTDQTWYGNVGGLYSTREAALAARDRGGEG